MQQTQELSQAVTDDRSPAFRRRGRRWLIASAGAIAVVGSTLAVVADDARPPAPSTAVVSPASSTGFGPLLSPVSTDSMTVSVATDPVTDAATFDR